MTTAHARAAQLAGLAISMLGYATIARLPPRVSMLQLGGA
jgi:hypothetical protein